MKLKHLTVLLALASMTTFAAPAKTTGKKIRGGEIVKAYFEEGRKVKILSKNGAEYDYLNARPGKKYLHLVVTLKKDYSLSTQDYILKSGAAGFRASSIAKYGKDYMAGMDVVKANGKDTTFKMLFEVPKSSTKFDLEFKLKTSITQPVIKDIKVATK